MALVAVTCFNCQGKGYIQSEKGDGNYQRFKLVTCNECDGAGSVLVHTSAFNVSVDPASNSIDDTSVSIWRTDDDGSLEVLDLFELSQRRK